jgi:hypothetical protein
MALVGAAIWGAIWLGHWLWAERLRTGTTEQSAHERFSRVRLAYLVWIVVYGALTVLSAVAASLSVIFGEALGARLFETYRRDEVLWYPLLAPTLAAVFAALAWWWHRRRALLEDADGPIGVSATRVVGYSTALVGFAALTMGLAQSLAAIFGEWFAPRISLPFDLGPEFSGSLSLGSLMAWQTLVATAGSVAVVGLAVWIGPWIFAQARRAPQAAQRELEVASSSRSYYIFSVGAVSMVVAAVALAMIANSYLRVTFGLRSDFLGSEISGPLAWLLVAAAVYAYHWIVLRADRAPVVPPMVLAAPLTPPPPPPPAPPAAG